MAERTLMLGLSILALGQGISASCLPRVDLGYQLHEALSFDVRPETSNLAKSDTKFVAEPEPALQVHQYSVRRSAIRRLEVPSSQDPVMDVI
jgi:hypothetical protein